MGILRGEMNLIMKKMVFLNKTNYLFVIAIMSSIIYAMFKVCTSFLQQLLIDAGIEGDNIKLKKFTIFCILYLILFLIIGLINAKIQALYRKKVTINYKRKMINSILHMKYEEYIKKNSAAYISSLTNDIAIIETDFVDGRVTILTEIIVLLVVVISMAVYNIKLLLIVALSLLLPFFVSLFTSKKALNLTSKVSNKNSGFVELVKDSLLGYSTIKSFRAENTIIDKINRFDNELEIEKAKLMGLSKKIVVVSEFCNLFITLIVFFAGVLFVIKKIMTIGQLMAFVQLLLFANYPLKVLPQLITKYISSKEIINKNNIENDNNDMDNDVDNDCIVSECGDIEYRNVSFNYNGLGNVLNNVNFSFEKGKIYAIAGLSGSGKTTLLSLLQKKYVNYSGEIFIGNKNIKNIDNIYNYFSVIQQDSFIFDDTIINNISMYNNYDAVQINNAIERSGLRELISQKSENYLCGENGVNLSGGEKQRISIARSLINNKEIIILDESTSHLDAITVNEIEKTILQLKGTTRFYITHSLNRSFLEQCDCILILKNGTISESGSFDDLIEKKGVFYSMFNIQ